MSRPHKYPWFTWFNEDKHRIARWWFNDLSDNSIRKIICGQAKRMGVKATVTINERWVWISAVRIGQLIRGAK